MKVNFNQLASQLNKQLPKISWVSGDEPWQQLEAANLLRSAAKNQGITEREVFDVAGNFNWQSLLEASASLSLFASSKLIEVRLSSNKLGCDGTDTLKTLCANLANSPDVYIFTSPRLEASQKRSAWYSGIDKAGWVIEVWPLMANQLTAFINDQAQKAGLQLHPAASQLLAEKTEGNLLAAVQEIEKLKLFASETNSTEISPEELIQLTEDASRFNLFDLSDACLAGNPERSVRILQSLQSEGTENTLLLWVLTRELRQLYQLTALQNQGVHPSQAYKQLGIWQNKQQLYSQAARRLSLAKLTGLINLAQQTDLSIKTSAPETASQLLHLVAQLSR